LRSAAVDILALAGRLAADLPALTLGECGCLLEMWCDREGLGLVRLIDGWPDGGADAALGWRRDPADPTRLALDRAVLGLRVTAPDPLGLADGLDHVAARLDALIPHVQAALERDIPADAGELDEDPAERLRGAVIRALHRDLPLPRTPPGVRLRPAEAAPGGRRRVLDADAVRTALHTPDVQDHRAVIPPRRARISES